MRGMLATMQLSTRDELVYVNRRPIDFHDTVDALRRAIGSPDAHIIDYPLIGYRDLVMRLGQIFSPKTLGGIVNRGDISYMSGVFPGVTIIQPGITKIPGSSVFNYFQTLPEDHGLPGVGGHEKHPYRLLNTPNISQEGLLQAIRIYDKTGDPTLLTVTEFAFAARRPVTAIEDGRKLQLIINTISKFDDANVDFLDKLLRQGKSFKRVNIGQAAHGGLIVTFPAFAFNQSLAYSGRSGLRFPVIRHADPLVLPGEHIEGYPTMAILVGIGPEIYPLQPGEERPHQAEIERILANFTAGKIRHFMVYMRALAITARSVLDLIQAGKLTEPEEPMERFIEYLDEYTNYQIKTKFHNYFAAALRPHTNPEEFPKEPVQIIATQSGVLGAIQESILREFLLKRDRDNRRRHVQEYPVGEEIIQALTEAEFAYHKDVSMTFNFVAEWLRPVKGLGFPDLISNAIGNILTNVYQELMKTYPGEKEKRMIAVDVDRENGHLRIEIMDSGTQVSQYKLDRFNEGIVFHKDMQQGMLTGADGLIGGAGTDIFKTLLGYSGVPNSYVMENLPEGGRKITIRMRLAPKSS